MCRRLLYGRLDEGLDMRDLKDAEAVLAQVK